MGGYGIEDARTLEQLADRFEVLPLAQAASAAFPRRNLSADEARRLANGGRLAAAASTDAQARTGPQASTAAGQHGRRPAQPAGQPGPQTPTAAYAPDGTLIALVAEESGQARPLVVFA